MVRFSREALTFLLSLSLRLSRSSRSMTALAVFVPVIAVALALSLSIGLRDWVWSSLGYGYVPVGLWLAAFALSFRYRRPWVKEHYGLWLGGALVVVASLGILSLFYPEQGVLEETSLGGNWGRVLGGDPLALGLLKVALALVLIPPAVAPQWSRDRSRQWVLILNRALGAGLQALGRKLQRDPEEATVLEIEEAEEDKGSLPKRIVKRVPRLPRLRPAAKVGTIEADAHLQIAPPNKVVHVSKWRLPSVDLLSKGSAQTVPQPILDKMARRI